MEKNVFAPVVETMILKVNSLILSNLFLVYERSLLYVLFVIVFHDKS